MTKRLICIFDSDPGPEHYELNDTDFQAIKTQESREELSKITTIQHFDNGGSLRLLAT